MKSRQLISSEEAKDTGPQHATPCGDCPFARTALQGWLGGMTIEEWLQAAHGNAQSDCHCSTSSQCAGFAIYRANVCKLPLPGQLKLPADRVKVFATPMEFREHHSRFDKRKK